MIGFGGLGSNPYAIGNVLKNEGISYSRVDINGMNKPGIYIISFWTGPLGSPLHTVAVSYDGTTYTTYNYNGYGDLFFGDPNEYAARYRYECGYYLG